MILKGNSRAGAIDLALHLSNEIDNETVTIHSVRGATSNDLYGAFQEWELICSQTKATKPFYSLSLNPDPVQRDWTDKEWGRAIEAAEAKLGLSGQPRAVVLHHKVGESDGELRKHCHVVWSRIDGRTLKAVHMGNDRYKLKACSKELAKEFGLELRYGEHGKREAYDHALSQGQNRDPETAKDRKDKITKLWNEHSDSKAFETAMRQAGYVVAQGDRRAFVIVDSDGEAHSLARQITGVKTKDVKNRLGDPASYPDVTTAKDEQAIRRKAEAEAFYKSVSQPAKMDLSVEQKLFAKLRRMAQRTDVLKVKRRRALQNKHKDTGVRHKQEKSLLVRKFRQREGKRLLKRHRAKPKRLVAGLRRIFGYELVTRWKQAREDQKRASLHEKRLERLTDVQAFERDRLERQQNIIIRQEKREAQSIAKLAKKLGLSKQNKIEIDTDKLERSLAKERKKQQGQAVRLV